MQEMLGPHLQQQADPVAGSIAGGGIGCLERRNQFDGLPVAQLQPVRRIIPSGSRRHAEKAVVRIFCSRGGESRVNRCRQRHCPAPSSLSSLRPKSEEHTSELQSLMRISYAVFCLKKKKIKKNAANCTRPQC